MNTENYFAAIDLGSLYTTALVAQKTENGKINVIACEQVESRCIRHGEVKNLQDTAFQIGLLVKQLENHKTLRDKKLEIKKMYVGLNGHTLKTHSNVVKRVLGSDEEVSDEMVADMLNENLKIKIEGSEIYEIIEQEFLVDNEWEYNPVGMCCSQIQGAYKIIHGKPELRRNLLHSFKKANEMEVAGLCIASMATAEAVLTEADKEIGCALVDFGADTTTLSVYYNGCLRHTAVIPFGGKAVTNDIKDLNVTEADAEKMKVRYGNAMAALETKNRNIVVPGNGNEQKTVSTTFLAGIIEARMTEIIDVVWAEIQKSKFSSRLGNGIIITGRAANLNNLEELLKFRTGCDVRYADYHQHLSKESDEKYNHLINAQLIGLLLLAEESCLAEKKEEVKVEEETEKIKAKEKKEKSKKSKNTAGGLLNLFGKKIEGLFDLESDEKLE